MAPVVDLIAYKSFFGQCNTGAYDQRCEPKTDSRFFRSFLFDFSQQKTDCLKSVFRLSKKTETEKPVFLGRFFHVRYVKNAHISVWKPRYGWTHGQLRHTVASAAQQQQQCMGAVVGVGRLNT